jgi:hypothetical protein
MAAGISERVDVRQPENAALPPMPPDAPKGHDMQV